MFYIALSWKGLTDLSFQMPFCGACYAVLPATSCPQSAGWSAWPRIYPSRPIH